MQSQPLSMLKKEIKQSFVNLSAIVDPDIKRKRKITLKEWTNWLQHDRLSEAEDKMFNVNPEHVDWRKKFLTYSENDEKISFSQVDRMGKINICRISFHTKNCLKTNLIDCFIAKKRFIKIGFLAWTKRCLRSFCMGHGCTIEDEADKTASLTWTEFVHWINSLGK